jgi:hypothetical protein
VGRFTATFEFSDIRVRWNLDRDLPLADLFLPRPRMSWNLDLSGPAELCLKKKVGPEGSNLS